MSFEDELGKLIVTHRAQGIVASEIIEALDDYSLRLELGDEDETVSPFPRPSNDRLFSQDRPSTALPSSLIPRFQGSRSQ